MSELKDLPKTFYDRVWNARDASGLDDLMHPDFVHEGVTGEEIRGRDAFREFHARLCAAFSEIHFEISHVLVDGDQVAYQHHARLTHAATGKEVNFGGVVIVRVRDGMYFSGVESVDWVPVLQEVGILGEDAMDRLLG